MRVRPPDGQEDPDEATPSHPEQIIHKLREADQLVAEASTKATEPAPRWRARPAGPRPPATASTGRSSCHQGP
jgi:hypothetical protein